MRITLTATDVKIITKKANPYERRDDSGRVIGNGVSYRLGILYRDELFTLKCSEETFNNTPVGIDCDIEILCQDGKYAGVDNAITVIPKNPIIDKSVNDKSK
jgi:hypothetical protein